MTVSSSLRRNIALRTISRGTSASFERVGHKSMLPSATYSQDSHSEMNSQPTLATRFGENAQLQSQSLLFSKLPLEIRKHVYHLALAEYFDERQPVPFGSAGFRPEHSHRRCCAVELLRTCKLIYLETYLLPAQLVKHVAWLCPPERAPFGRVSLPFQRMTYEQHLVVESLHVYAGQRELEEVSWPSSVGLHPSIRIKHLAITIRQTDWVDWTRGRPLRMDASHSRHEWRKSFMTVFSYLKTFTLELEVVKHRCAELDDLVDDIKEWRLEDGHGKVMVTTASPPQTRLWIGSSHFSGIGGPVDTPGAVIEMYYIVTLIWRSIDV